MDLDQLDFAAWAGASPTVQRGLAEEAARRTSGHVVTLRNGPTGLPVAELDVRGCRMVLVPGGASLLGWAGDPLAVDADALQRYEREQSISLQERVRSELGPARTVRLPPFLLEAEARRIASLIDPYADDVEERLGAIIAGEGFRMVSDDEWEHAVRAGATTLFRWGDTWPDGIPYGDETTFTGHRAPTALGLVVSSDPYAAEITSDGTLRGGDGGSAVCGGETPPGSWTSFALAFRVPREGWEEIVSETFEEGLVRRALSLPA